MQSNKLIMETKESGGVLSVKISGVLNLQNINEFRTNLDNWDESVTHQVMLDLKGLNFIDSSGIGALVQGIQNYREHDVDLKVVNVPKPFQKVIEEIGLGGFL